jgi:plastocyanin
MAGQTWCITISGNPATFVPDVYSESPTPPAGLQAQVGDTVSWNNQSEEQHQPWETDVNHVLQGTAGICDVIEPWEPSTPGYVLQLPTGTKAPVTISYRCAVHRDRDEFGTIDIIA